MAAVRVVSAVRSAISASFTRQTHTRKWVREQTGESVESFFGESVFNDVAQEKYVPKFALDSLKSAKQNMHAVEPTVVDAYASGLKQWAMERGASHFTHWFKPLTGATAMKHETFFRAEPGKTPLSVFKGTQLARGEPDSSSFPSGGLRQTHAARGYTVWDPNSPPFLIEHGNGATLYIPSIFLTWNGEAQDEKLPLLRSLASLQTSVLRLLHATGDERHTRVHSDSGVEQEFFLIDRKHFESRLDLQLTGRTLIGAAPPKGQEREDQYFADISERMTNAIQDAEVELFRLGVPMICRHREVAPGQYEVAPNFESAVTASDKNMLMMMIMDKVTRRHELKILFHEKPFQGVNGSGKHNNWSVGTNVLPTVFNPGPNPETNPVFNLFVAAVLRMVDQHGDLLRIAVSGAGNDHRLGANEAPPSIMSVFLGQDVYAALYKFCGLSQDVPVRTPFNFGKVCLPHTDRDTTDRNRTAPFAYTGMKFEFRAVGASQVPHRSNTVLNTILADVADAMADEITAKRTSGSSPADATRDVIRDTVSRHDRVVFQGNGYSAEWRAEAKKRGLFNLVTTVDALEQLCSPKNVELFEKHRVLTKGELHARQEIFLEDYIKTINIEAKCLATLARGSAAPAGVEATGKLTHPSFAAQQKKVSAATAAVFAAADALDAAVAAGNEISDVHERARYTQGMRDKMAEARLAVDTLETLVALDTWPMPHYHNMLFEQD